MGFRGAPEKPATRGPNWHRAAGGGPIHGNCAGRSVQLGEFSVGHPALGPARHPVSGAASVARGKIPTGRVAPIARPDPPRLATPRRPPTARPRHRGEAFGQDWEVLPKCLIAFGRVGIMLYAKTSNGKQNKTRVCNDFYIFFTACIIQFDCFSVRVFGYPYHFNVSIIWYLCGRLFKVFWKPCQS